MSKIRKSFDEWYVKDYRKNRGNLYHEWLFLQMFPTEHLDFNEKTKNKIHAKATANQGTSNETKKNQGKKIR